jgi:hypothetical protein
MPTALEVKSLENYRVWLRFSDGVEGIASLSEFAGKGVFKMWDIDDSFRRVRIGEGGGIEWGDQIDLCPDALYLKITGKTPGEVFPSLRKLVEHAGN